MLLLLLQVVQFWILIAYARRIEVVTDLLFVCVQMSVYCYRLIITITLP